MAPAATSDQLLFFVNGKKIIEKNADPETMLLPHLRKRLLLTGTKYGCGGGGCGACTVMVSTFNPVTKKILHYTANACLLPICSLYGAAVTTVEGIGSTATRLHPVQERIAKAHGSQCGFCTPGMVMSIYTLLRNHPEPTMEQITEALDGNLCRCTGYRPIIDGCKTFCNKSDCCQVSQKEDCCLNKRAEDPSSPEKDIHISTSLFKAEEFLPLDPTQEPIFPPELMLLAERGSRKKLVFQGERIQWISPPSLTELLELKALHPKAPLVVGNTSLGPDMKFKGVFHPILLSPAQIPDLNFVKFTEKGLTLSAFCSLAQMKDILSKAVAELSTEKTKIFRALLQQLKTLGGQQIRNTASLGGNIMSRASTSDLNPVLAAGNCTLIVPSKERTRMISMDETFFAGSGKASLQPEEILVSVLIPYSTEWEFVSALRQAQRRANALPIVNAGMRVLFNEDSDVIADLRMYYGGVGFSTVGARQSCQKLTGSRWSQEMLNEACSSVLEEVSLCGSAPGGMVEYRRTLTISFLFRFFLQVAHELKQKIASYHGVPEHFTSALEELHRQTLQSLHAYQDVSLDQPSDDPVGRPIVHQSGIKQATGEAVYVDDMPAVDGELFLAFVTSSRAHAKILSMDTSEALGLPGVVDIVMARDVPGTQEFNSESGTHLLFAGNEVLCVGQIICAVVADTPTLAKRAAAKVKIVYENLEPVIITIEDAIKHKSFYKPDRWLEQGNVKEAFGEADQVIEGEIHIGGQEHFYMETQSIRVVPTGEDREMDIYVSTQHPAYIQAMVSMALNVSSSRITCHVKRVGGAFGGKISKTALLACITAVAANKTKRAVRCVLERGEDMLITGGRHPFLGKYKVGFMNNGRITAVDVAYYTNAGFMPEESIEVVEVALLTAENVYKIPNLRVQGWACKTHLPSNIAFRGFGYPQAALVAETWIDAVATKSGLSPQKIRESNFYRGIDRTHYSQEIDARNLVKCWNDCLQKSDYYDRREAADEFNKHSYWKKRGLALIPMKFPIGSLQKCFGQAAALVHIYVDGSVLVTHGGVEMGQGVHTKIIQVASRELGIPLSYIHLCETSTSTVPNTCASGGSCGTDVNGMAVKNACQILMQRLEPIMKKNPSGTWVDWVKEAFQECISLSATGFFGGYGRGMDWEKRQGHLAEYYVYGAACSEVEIDCLTGDHKNLRTDIVMDIGCSINPGVDIGQIEGAFVQGLGLFTMEELKFSPGGVLYTRGPGQYKIPAICDIPEQFRVFLLTSSPNPSAIYSSKGIGEPALFLGSSIYFAIKDAVVAARKERGLSPAVTLNSPLTPERVRMACGDHLTAMIPKDDPDSYVPWAANV
ncbi:aldehyde oxidase [Ambystoma mexicanum]|uniref:aldehyde oxidase n=1 Tax=Ambystoma mexicanum TaxID=8296 RepID=UPI0037E867E1